MAVVNIAALDARFWLSGDDEGNVGLRCRTCETGGQPIAYYDRFDPRPLYRDNPAVENVTTIFDLLAAAGRHERTAHEGEAG